ncbi:MAG: protein-glutamate O-methyltransferase [Pelagimonas sp.]|uniref:protein-glutamate O-methyltransferase n=1 Tax=Pelagimonas sp. TaxID=2073170 RepID=UPI003D6A88F1
MNFSPPEIKQGEIPFSDDDFRSLANLAKLQFGLNLAESKKPLVYSRLSKRLKARGVFSFPEYISLLVKPGEENEKFELISALTTNVTSFFREIHHFKTLEEEIIPDIIENAKNGRRVRLWSAGCSAGPEPYSLAMTLLKAFPEAKEYDVRILATDIDPKIIERARIGRYTAEEIDGISPDFRSKWINKIAEKNSFEVSSNLKKLITFNELNLVSEWPFSGSFDAIFCRNVAIYFDQETQQKLWQKFCNHLTSNGVLFIGHSERVTGSATRQLEGIGITSYRKVSNSAEDCKNRRE